ncbi:amidase [Leucobacter weissii]|uniref:Amidase n=1 Tax=Leucobacter weissii TaxID=1983706 RepID=A0A939S508_9MICO|nr:amidase [Leucobacter weissii]MBO1900834.1 amidase [Leucobacter weissii]
MSETFAFEEITIDEILSRYASGALTVREVVQAYLDRIDAVDRSGPSLNSIVALSPRALDDADALDRAFAGSGRLSGPLHGVPVLVKDQVEVGGMPTSYGSEIAAESMPERDSTVVRRLRDSGAVILGTTTMPDFATSWFSTSSRSGVTKNPYDLSRDPGGSSSGSAAAIAANLALVGIGGDTGGSIRLPASFCNLVGLRVTPGIISRDGMSSLVVPQDTPGPMTRTVEDAARLLDVVAGWDPADPFTSVNRISHHTGSYAEGLAESTMSGKRLGVLRGAFGDPSDPDGARVNAVLERALEQLVAAGGEVVDVEIEDLMHLVGFTSVYNTRSHADMNAFFATRPGSGVKGISEVIESGRYHEKLDLLEGIAATSTDPADDPEYLNRILAQQDFQREVVGLLAELGLDAIVFPDVKLPAPTHDEVFSDKWTCLTYPTNTVIASQLHFPAITVPVGFTDNDLPVGLEIISAPYDEHRLLNVAAAVEKATGARRAPAL